VLSIFIVVVFVDQKSYIIELITVIGENYYFYLQNRQFINLRKFFKFVCQN